MSAPICIRARPPLVVDVGRGFFAWVERGLGFMLHTASGRWQPMTDVVSFGGRVMDAAGVGALVLRFGRPL